MEILPLLDWEELRAAPPKWVLGYSDISTFTFAYTLLTGTASAHGTNYIDLGSREWDSLTRRWVDVLSLTEGGQITQVTLRCINLPGNVATNSRNEALIWIRLLGGVCWERMMELFLYRDACLGDASRHSLPWWAPPSPL